MSDERSRFDAIVARVVATMPDEDTRASIEKTLTERWERPPMEKLEQVLRRKLSINDARRILFLPEVDDFFDYAVAFSQRPPGCPPEHPLSKIQPLFMGMLYMVHREDERLMRAFVVRAGGLRTLVGLLADDNVYIVSQALDTLYSLTGLFDWHADPPSDRPLLQCMADLAHADVGFVRALEGCFENRFPGCSFRALTILAFWLGLIRFFFCKGRVLRLGPDVLDLLHRWSVRRDGVGEDELKLACALHDDFARFPLDDGAARSGDSSLTTERPENLELATAALPAAVQATPARAAGGVAGSAAVEPPLPSAPVPIAKAAGADAQHWSSDVLDELDD
ncbi:hypothetical protein KFE25_006829 [Diacronema lutheri]|uniref:Uncharacterized protein n=1 Tax=Diacronema lutheri TaxID=2081491 RepID=A0A8J5XSU0_DIALT|nr:hypothetical protein KFE25_006829 [Diacronema lutheri]